MILSKGSEKLLKRLARQRKEYERKYNKENEYASPFSVTNTFSEIEKILPNQSYVSLRGLLNYLLKEKYIFNNIKGKEDGSVAKLNL